MNERDRRKVAELADRYPIIRDALANDGLNLIAKYRRDHKPWWRRAVRFVAQMFAKRK